MRGIKLLYISYILVGLTVTSGKILSTIFVVLILIFFLNELFQLGTGSEFHILHQLAKNVT